MRLATDVPVTGIRNKMAPNTFIPSTANLSITIKTGDKPGNPIKYRAIRRPDGVVVERPRYQPSVSSVPHSKTISMPSKLPATFPGVGRHNALIKKMNEDLAAIGSSWEEMSDACARDRAGNRGRDGYNQPHEIARVNHEIGTTTTDNKLVMELYLDTDGPWGVYNLRER
jgi:hypothetical protein